MTAPTVDAHLTQWGEAVGYYRADDDGTPQKVRTIQAVISRTPVVQMDGVDGAGRPALAALIKNDETTGIAAADLNTARDTLYLSERIGGDSEHFGIERILHQDSNALDLELR